MNGYAFFEQLYTRAPEKLLHWNLAGIDYIFGSFDLPGSYLLQSEIWGEFIKDLSAMDLLFNCGPYSRTILERVQKQGRGV